MPPHLDGRVALVSGGSRGIGEATAAALARAGAHVIITSRKPDGVSAAVERLRATTGGTVDGLPCNVGQVDQVDALCDEIFRTVGPIDFLVANAATNVYFGPLIDADEGAWDKTFDVNLKGTFWLARRVAKELMAHERPGSLVLLSSILGLGAAPLQGVYGMTKAAVSSMAATLAFELGPASIRVNAVAPGLVDTKLAAALIENDRWRSAYEARTALGRVGQPGEIASLIAWLLSDEAAYVTGQTLAADGGYTQS